MDTQDEPEQQPTIAGRALRALRTTRAPAEPSAEAPDVAEPPADGTVVDLVKAPAKADTVDAAGPEVAEADAAEVSADEATEDDADDTEADEAPTGAKVGSRRNALLVAAVMVVVAALAFAVIGLVVYLKGTTSSAADAAKARDDALVAARIDIATLQTLDYQSVKPGLQKWLAVTTGDFHDQIAGAIDSEASTIASAKRVTVGKVVAAALTDIDVAAGTASAIATVDVTVTPAGGTSALQRNRYHANLKIDHGVWKIADLSLVPVGLS